jgi:hypothetical protein
LLRDILIDLLILLREYPAIESSTLKVVYCCYEIKRVIEKYIDDYKIVACLRELHIKYMAYENIRISQFFLCIYLFQDTQNDKKN